MGFGSANNLPKNIGGVSGKGFSGKEPQVIRKTTHFEYGGRDYRALREKVKKLGTINALVKNADGQMVHEKIKDKELFDQVKRAIKSGTLSTKWQREVLKNKGFTAINPDGSRKTYIISGSQKEIGQRKALGCVFEQAGPSREKIAADLKKQDHFKRLNIISAQLGREREDGFAGKLAVRRQSGAKNSIDLRNSDNTKANAGNIGVQARQSSVSALAGKRASIHAGTTVSVPKANESDNVVSLDAHRKTRGISPEPLPRTGTNG